MNFAVKVATSGGLSPGAIGLFRWGTFAVVLLLVLRLQWFQRLTRAQWPSPRDAAWAVLAGMLLFAPAHLAYYLALTRTSTIEGTVLNTTSPVWTALLAFLFLRERVAGRRGVAIAVGFIGAWIVSVGFSVPQMRAGNTAGNLLYLAGVLAESGVAVLSASLIRRSSGITVLALQIVGASVTLGLAPILLGDALPFQAGHVAPSAVAAVAYLILFPGLICFTVWYMLVEKTPLSLMVLSILLQPPLSALVGWLVLKEPLTTQLAAGTAFVLTALLLGATEERERLAPV